MGVGSQDCDYVSDKMLGIDCSELFECKRHYSEYMWYGSICPLKLKFLIQSTGWVKVTTSDQSTISEGTIGYDDLLHTPQCC